jgi:hypothetical protein
VFELDPTTGDLKQLGPALSSGTEFNGGMPYALVSLGGKLWVGTNYGTAGGQTPRLYSIRPGTDTSWTLETTFASGFHVQSLAVYKGELFAGMRADGGTAIRLYKRDNSNALTVSDNTGTTSVNGYGMYTALTVYDGNLFALLYDNGAGVDISERIKVRKFNGTSWSTVYTLDEGGGESRTQNKLGMGLVVNGALFFTIGEPDTSAGGVGAVDANSDGLILRSTNGTSFTEVEQITNLRGFIGFTKV